jgi:hypothetical protein
MRISHGRKQVVLGAVGLFALASVAVAAGAGLTTTGRISAAAHAPFVRRADRLGRLARKTIVRRQAALRGRSVAAGPAPDPLALAAMRDVALEMSSQNGDAHPYDGEVFSSTRNLAETVISGDTVNTDQPVYAVVFHGNFVGYLASVPAGAQLPTGHVMTIVFDAQTLEVTDWGLVDRAPATAKLGAGNPLGL